MIVIEIKNAEEVAERESPLIAKTVRKFTPNLLKKKVEEKIVESLKETFSERGIEAEFIIRNQ